MMIPTEAYVRRSGMTHDVWLLKCSMKWGSQPIQANVNIDIVEMVFPSFSLISQPIPSLNQTWQRKITNLDGGVPSHVADERR
jgi:hypothetical protein